MLIVLMACHGKGDSPTDDTGTRDDTAYTPPFPAFESAQIWHPAGNDWEPFGAADSSSTWVYQVTTHLDHGEATIAFRASDDNGATWGDDKSIGPGTYQWDPMIAVAPETGCVYAEWLVPVKPWRTYLVHTCDHGETFSDPVSISESWESDHGWLVVSPDGQDIYIAFNGTQQGKSEDFWQAAVAVSHDGGETFDVPWVTGDGGDRYWFQTGGAMAPDGTVYFAAVEYTHDYTGDTTIGVHRSTDGGASFEISEVATAAEPRACDWAKGCEFGFLAAQAAVGVDSAGSVLVEYQTSATAGDPQSMAVVTSPGGDHWQDWSAPVLLDAKVSDHGFPSAAAGPTPGDFRVAWQENEEEDVAAWSTRYQRTTDGGATWLSDSVELNNGPYGFPYGDYISISVDSDGFDHVIWAEGPSYDGPGGTWYTRGTAW